jgi:hypothetical protein
MTLLKDAVFVRHAPAGSMQEGRTLNAEPLTRKPALATGLASETS